MTPADLFPTGGPVSRADVVDRGDFIDDIVRRLLDRHSVMLSGPRRLGKSTLAYEVLRRLREDEGCYTAAMDFATVASVRDLAERLIALTIANVVPVARLAMSVGNGIGSLAHMPEVRTRLGDLGLSYVMEAGREPGADVLLEEALGLPERIAARDRRRFVLMLDEFQLAEEVGGPTLIAKMRGMFQVQRHTAFLFLGSQAGTMAQLFGASNQPFFRFAAQLSMPPVPAAAWREYIARRFAEHRIEVEDGALDAILEHTGGHPYDTMRVAYEAYLLARRPQRLPADLAAAACRDAQQNLGDVFEAEIDALGARARVILRRIATGESPYADERSRAAVERTLRLLVLRGVVRKGPGRGRYELVEPMLARHLASAAGAVGGAARLALGPPRAHEAAPRARRSRGAS